jgi:peptidyl-dipeptidase A
VTSAVDVDRFFQDKDLEELTRKTYDSMGLEARDVLGRVSDEW